ncbi:uncharacterized protein LOC107266899 isoform X2 [Cephus cinctus]|uniref:Uncharacterized protein LOC107266899 isoform X2 n=1 Tax=Cephus cinctus TaxID=211228 RepID=A0AAJ7BSR0_CEPCN|nr:uncharacterized protein LOC107266899 isoform X2 [Cephus cinctus]
MEISKSLQEEILSVQSKLKNAIRDHQICVGKLKDDPNNTDILGQIQEIQLHIVSLGRCQKQVVQRLRKEVEDFKADNVNGAKVSVASLLGINNNNHITNNNEDRSELAQSKEINGISRRTSKDDYEEVVHNGDVPSPTSQENDRAKERPYSVETISGEDEVIEVSLDENSHEKPEEDPVEKKIESMEQTTFLGNLGLITIDRFTELQNKRAERKRRSTANPQFVYSNWEIPTSAGNAPQTRQTTARLNGPSPPPSKTSPPKSSSPSTRTPTKSLIPTQKATTRPNILRNAQESKVFPGKGKLENGSSQVQLPSAKSVQSVGSKAVHIPGLPSSLTIERIENDSSVCIHCRNPGTLTICDNCSANYHVSCHSVSPAPSRTCPKCAPKCKDREDGPAMSCKKDDELGSASYASGVAGKAGKDTEVHKATRGLYKTNAANKRQHLLSNVLSINQLPSSTFLIPITANTITTNAAGQEITSGINASINNNTTTTSTGTITCPTATDNREQFENTYPPVVLNQLTSQSSVSYVQSESQVSYAYQLSVNNSSNNGNSSNQSEKHQSYLIVKKISEPSGLHGKRGLQQQQQQYTAATIAATGNTSDLSSQSEIQDQSVSKHQQSSATNNESRIDDQSKVAHVQRSSNSGSCGKHTDAPHESIDNNNTRGRKKSANRSVPALHRLSPTETGYFAISGKHNDRPESSDTFNGRKSESVSQSGSSKHKELRIPQKRETILCINRDSKQQLGDDVSLEQLEVPRESNSKEDGVVVPDGCSARDRSRSNSLFYSLFSGHQRTDLVSGDTRSESRESPDDDDDDDDEDDDDDDDDADDDDDDDEDYIDDDDAEYDDEECAVLRKLDKDGNPQSISGKLECSVSGKHGEHVKLEEAHLPAPLRAKLTSVTTVDSDENGLLDEEEEEEDEEEDYDEPSDDPVACDEEEVEFECQQESLDSSEEHRHEIFTDEGKLPRTLIHQERTSMDTVLDKKFVLLEQFHNTGIKGTVGEMNYDVNQTKNSQRRTRDDDVHPRRNSADGDLERRLPGRSNLSELRRELSVPEDKADTERQDLVRPQHSKGSTHRFPDALEDSAEDSKDVIRTRSEIRERLGMNNTAVSTESMQVLEQFESVILNANDASDAAR